MAIRSSSWFTSVSVVLQVVSEVVSYEVRSIGEGDLREFLDNLALAFNFDWKDEDRAHFAEFLEMDRTVAVYEGDVLVATAGAFSLDLTVPGGGRVPTGGTTIVSVRPTHRRRGLLRRMMSFHLDDVRRRGEPLAALWASDSGIYARFGYGLATRRLELEIEKGEVVFAGEPPPGRVDLVDGADSLGAIRAVYDRAAAARPGMFARDEHWWRRVRHDPEHHRDGLSSKRYALYTEDGEPHGYAVYRTKEKWERGHGSGKVDVVELITATPPARAGLWRYFCGLDLVTGLEAWNAPVDEALPWLVVNPRRVHTQVFDALWVRVMDVPAALSARHYRVPGRVVFELTGSEAAGVYELDAGPDGAECKPSHAEPDLTLDAAALGAVYLGGTSLATLAAAGHATGSAGAVRRADLMFSWHEQPWCQEVF